MEKHVKEAKGSDNSEFEPVSDETNESSVFNFRKETNSENCNNRQALKSDCDKLYDQYKDFN